MHPHAQTRIVLVTGASRGVGADVALRLAGPDTHVVVNYREHTERAQHTVDAIRDAGGHASMLAADISDDDDVTTMIEVIRRRFGRLDTVVLTASGGHEHELDPGSAMRVNGAAQRRLARLALPMMSPGGHIVFVTSHQAHFYPHKAVPKGYAAVAAGKRAGETALYAMRTEFHRAGVRFAVVSGDLVDESIIARLLHRSSPGNAEPHDLPAALDGFAAAIADAATVPNPSGVVYVNGPDHPAQMTA